QSQKVEGHRKQHQVQLDLDPHLPAIPADSELLSYAFSAILENAHRYTIESGLIQVQTHSNSGHIHIHFLDNGIGMDPDALSRIFERFYRVDEAHTTAGFGVGLAIAKSIVELHQGTISAQSEAGSGSTFTVKLPIAVQV
ncbi:MAG: sensor histidine kinase, partial [Anaerolineae bacterium]|nr:sensor histidine kinase [Anaerolineae bacterium]